MQGYYKDPEKTAEVMSGDYFHTGDKGEIDADGFLKIPMVGYTESLNISVSAAIIIQDITNRLRNSAINWQLTEDEVKRLEELYKSHPILGHS